MQLHAKVLYGISQILMHYIRVLDQRLQSITAVEYICGATRITVLVDLSISNNQSSMRIAETEAWMTGSYDFLSSGLSSGFLPLF